MDDRAGAPLSVRELPALLDRVHDALSERREVLDDLNVFPVPDGDTGTNMTLTVRASLQALGEAGGASGLERSKQVIRGAIRGARGNSGVILSQVIRAVVEELIGHHQVDGPTYARALGRARQLAYEAVAEPIEGTMLTAIAAAAAAAERAVAGGEDLIGASSRACEAVSKAVEGTREQLDVLRDAGVVDAGARGFEVLLAAVHGHLTGKSLAVHRDAPAHAAQQPDDRCHGSLAHAFEVQYLLDAEDDVAPVLRRELESIGDSVVVVAAGGLLNVHVHTGDVGAAIEAGIARGRPSSIEVTHFGDQMALRGAENQMAVGAVAVLSGDGATAIARSVGAEVVEGAAGNLPSVADLLNAALVVPAQEVLLLPGHRDALPTAHQAAGLAREERDRSVQIIDAAVTPPAVLAALAVLSPEADPAATVQEMTAAAEAVRTGEVVAALRDAPTPIGQVRAGQVLAVTDGQVVGVEDDPLAALRTVAISLELADAEIVTLLVGADVDGDERDAAGTMLDELTPDAEVELIDAGQHSSRYWVGVE